MYMYIYIYISCIYSRRFVGWISCISVVFCFSRSFSVLFLLCSVCFMFSLSLFKLLQLESNTHHAKHLKQTQNAT